MFFRTAGVTSYTVLVMPFLVDSLLANFCPASTGGNLAILVGLVRELCRYVPPVRSMVRVFSRLSGWMYRPRLAGSFRSTCVSPSHPRRMPMTSHPISAPRYTTDLITELSPGTSPPPVRIPIRFAVMYSAPLGKYELRLRISLPFYMRPLAARLPRSFSGPGWSRSLRSNRILQRGRDC